MPSRKPSPALRQQRFDYCPWLFATEATPVEKRHQAAHQKILEVEVGADFGERCFVSPQAAIIGTREKGFRLGDDGFVAAQAYVTGSVHLGVNCSINPFATLRDNIRGGDGIRIGAYSCLVGSNHGFADTETPIWKQPHTSKGIVLGDDIWIGSHVMIVDGVKVGSHSILAAGAVVTKDVPEYAIVGGNPARVIRLRKKKKAPAGSMESRLEKFGRRVEDGLEALLRRYQSRTRAKEICFIDTPGARKRVRPWCDAVEIAAMFGRVPPGYTAAELVTRLRSFQDAKTGLVPEHIGEDRRHDPLPSARPEEEDRYNTMIVNYALECLGSNLAWPVGNAANITEKKLIGHLDALPWEKNAWSAGHWIDCYASSLLPNRKYFDHSILLEPLMCWLNAHCDAATGLWGKPAGDTRWLLPVNGFYRLTRGTYAQYGRPLPYPERSIDTILRHSEDRVFFGEGKGDACNVLDVVHPIWLCLKQTDRRRGDAENWIRSRLPGLLKRWDEGHGFAFDPTQGEAGLQGTEMWLSIVYLMADVLGMAEALGYKPRGVHRLEPA